MTHNHTRSPLLWIFALAAIFMLAACGSPTPIPVYVTPTPAETATEPAIAVLPPSPTGTEDTPPPADTVIPTNTPEEPGATPTPFPTLPPGATYGPIVGPGHTLVPTETRIPPTLTPTIIPTAGPSPTPLPGLRRDLIGIQAHPYIDSRDFDNLLVHAKELDVTWIKFQFQWETLESSPGQLTELFYMLRMYVQRAHSQGFKVMASVAKAPGWSRSQDPDGGLREASPPTDPQVLAAFVGNMLNTIGHDATGQPYISAVEIWNEPNLQREWHGHPMTGQDYMRYFGPAYTAVRQFSPSIVVITAAPAPTGDSEWSTDDRTWIRQLYAAGLAQYGADVAVGIHPYGWANPPDARCCTNSGRGWDERPQFFFLDTIEEYRQIMVANGHSSAQLWVTEFGWATFEGLRTNNGDGPQPADPSYAPYFAFINQAQQAEYTIRAFQLGQERPYMGPMILWNLNFATLGGAVDQSDSKAGYGLLDSRWQPRPVYVALKQAPKN